MQGLTLTIRYESGGEEVFTLAGGDSMLVGSSPEADLQVDDSFLSGRHFRIAPSPDGWRVVDEGSSNGTYVNGIQQTEAALHDGAVIAAGKFQIFVRMGIPQDTPQQFLREYLCEQPPFLYAIVDAAHGSVVWEFLRRTEGLHQSLFDGESGEQLASAAPYLVAIDIHDPVLDVLIHDSWRQGWCTFVVSQSGFNELRNHLRDLLLVDEDQDEGLLYFRFYDPRVLRNFVPECDDDQLDELFECVDAFVVESAGTDEVFRFALVDGELETETVDLGVEGDEEKALAAAV